MSMKKLIFVTIICLAFAAPSVFAQGHPEAPHLQKRLDQLIRHARPMTTQR